MAFFQIANVHARIRARLGAMPDAARWRYLADADDLDNLIERMRASGLAHWVAELPRSPGTAAIEHCLHRCLGDLLEQTARLLPPRWGALGRRLRLAADLGWARRLLEQHDLEAPPRIDAALRPLFALDLDERARRLAQTPYQRYLASAHPFDRWLDDCRADWPRVSGREGYVLGRLVRALEGHRARLLALRRRANDAGDIDPAAQWRLRDELARELRALLGGYPFHAGVILAWCLLELLHFERCRALLVARARGWARPAFADPTA